MDKQLDLAGHGSEFHALDIARLIAEYESTGLSLRQEARLYRALIASGMIYSLQGTYQRRCQELIDNGAIKLRRR